MKGQSEAVSVILFTVIILGLVSAVYFWGMPIIEKRTAIAEFQTSLDFILDFDKKITDVVNSGSGSANIDIRGGAVTVIPYNAADPDNNTIIYERTITQPIAYNASTLLIKTGSSDEVGIYGESEPRIISIHIESSGDVYTLKFKIKYRELDSQNKGYKIALKQAGSAAGTNSVSISYDRKSTIPNGAANHGDLLLNIVSVTAV
ncbi:MAG: hypothetical protein ACXABY_15620 [Candidatus Thorarchaeota archaeon]|jgi:hypothetical protein